MDADASATDGSARRHRRAARRRAAASVELVMNALLALLERDGASRVAALKAGAVELLVDLVSAADRSGRASRRRRSERDGDALHALARARRLDACTARGGGGPDQRRMRRAPPSRAHPADGQGASRELPGRACQGGMLRIIDEGGIEALVPLLGGAAAPKHSCRDLTKLAAGSLPLEAVRTICILADEPSSHARLSECGIVPLVGSRQ